MSQCVDLQRKSIEKNANSIKIKKIMLVNPFMPEFISYRMKKQFVFFPF